MNRNNLIEEWDNFKKAPTMIIISVIIICFFIWVLLEKYVYAKRIDDKDSTIELLEKQLVIYKDKKFIVGETTFSKLSNQDLKAKSLQLFEKLNSTYMQYKSFDTLDHYSKNLTWEQSRDIENRQSIFGSMMIENYENNQLIDVILLREQILLRLPTTEAAKSDFRLYQYPTNPLGFKDLLDDFKTLILKLPDE
jgi:hypothetical protein